MKVEHARWRLNAGLTESINTFVVNPAAVLRGLDMDADVQMAYSPDSFPCISEQLLEIDFAAIAFGTPSSSNSGVSMSNETPSFVVADNATVLSGKGFNPNKFSSMADFRAGLAGNLTKKRIN